VGIATHDTTGARPKGKRRADTESDAPSVWFPSTESFAKVLSAANRDLIGLIAERQPGSLDELATITGRATSNLSRTLKTMAAYGLVTLDRGERGRIIPRVTHDRIELALPLTRS
jgi:predicted transcriptional regulator